MSKASTITLVMVSDNNLVVMLAALLRSIVDNHRSEEFINIYIVNDHISRRNVRRLEAIIDDEKVTLIWKCINDVTPPNYRIPLDNSSFPLNTYVRLFLYHFLSSDVKKAIYLDVDMIVLDDISRLWNTDLRNFPLAAVMDQIKVVSEPSHGILNYRSLGLDPRTKYFNSGLLVFNLDHWRDGRYAQKVMRIIEENKSFAKYPDQYGLNIAFASNWLELDERWNHYANRGIDNLPSLIHFISIKPIYHGYNFDADCKNIFFNYLDTTPWKKYKSKKDYHWKVNQFRYRLSKQTNMEILTKILKRINLLGAF